MRRLSFFSYPDSRERFAMFIAVLVALTAMTTAVTAEGGVTGGEDSAVSGFPLPLLIFFCVLTVCLSAMYCGLTIGIMGMDATTLEIIAEAGPSPDCVYANNILPLRRLGHQLLVMLLLGNMLTLVLTAQLIAAILRTSVLVNFITSTCLILIFGEIIPMSICSNGKYALYLGSASIPVLRLSLFVLYPICRPLGLLLDYLVPHEAGEVFDRAELKKLITLHSEKFASQTGMGDEESKMIVSALELKETSVMDVMTPLEKVRMVNSAAVMDSALQQTFWEWGKSRIPVFEGDGGKPRIVGLLYVKSLIGAFSREGAKNHTVREFLQETMTDIALVNGNVSLLQALTIFEKGRIQLLFVTQNQFSGGTPMFPPSKEGFGRDSISKKQKQRNSKSSRCDHEEDTSEEHNNENCRIISQDVLLHDEVEIDIVGILTLEDVIEKLISADILDEDEYDDSADGEVVEQEVSDDAVVPMFGDDHASPDGEAMRRKSDLQRPRVNFFSFSVPDSVESGVKPLSSDQRWVLAQYLSRSYVLFATWTIPHIMMLLSEVGDHVVYPQTSQPSACVLYTSHVASQAFTLLLSGGMNVTYDHSIQTEMRSFSSLGEEVLASGRSFTPQYTAVLSRPSRFIRITVKDVRAVEQSINKIRQCHRLAPVRLLPQKRVTVAPVQVVEAKTLR